MQALFSEHWHSVRRLKPRLRDGVRIYHRMLRGRHWVMLYDPSLDRFHRLTPEAYRVLELMDGRRTLDEVWDTAVAEERGEEAISQNELVQLLGRLHSSDLLLTQTTPDTAEVLERYKKQRRALFKQSFMNPLSIRIPLFSPEPMLRGHTKVALWATQPLALLLWLVIVTPAAVLAWMHWKDLTENLADRILSAGSLLLAWVTFPVIKAFHEYAHALFVKAWGGTVREIGIMFVFFTPVPYVDATASYGFTSKWQRAFVAAAGILAELAICAIAIYVWMLTQPGWIHALAYNAILITGASTLFVNGNPLMRYDGYFVLTDLIEIPNLAQRSGQYYTYLVDKYLYGSKEAELAPGMHKERFWLLVYGAVSFLYRLSVSLAIAWFIAGKYFFVGVIFALVGLWTALVLPIWRGWRHITAAPSLNMVRGKATRRTVLLLTLFVLVVGVVPFPFFVVTEAVTRLPEESYVRAGVDGQVARAVTRPGQPAQRGQLVAQMENLQVISEAARTLAVVEEDSAQLRLDETSDPVKAAGSRRKLAAETQRMLEAQHKLEQQSIYARIDGEFVVTNGLELVGQHFKRGDVIGYVVGDRPHLLYATISQDDAWLFQHRADRVEVRLERQPEVALPASIVREVPLASEQLFSAALGTQGGGTIPVDPSEKGGLKALNKVFNLELELDQPVDLQIFGDRAYIRFNLGDQPLAWQWALRFRQLLLARLNV